MASLKDAEKLTNDLEDLIGRLRDELQNGGDFEKVVAVADELSEQADGLAETFNSLNDTLRERLQGAAKAGSRGSTRRPATKADAKSAAGS
jgi:hypothetical protein